MDAISANCIDTQQGNIDHNVKYFTHALEQSISPTLFNKITAVHGVRQK